MARKMYLRTKTDQDRSGNRLTQSQSGPLDHNLVPERRGHGRIRDITNEPRGADTD